MQTLRLLRLNAFAEIESFSVGCYCCLFLRSFLVSFFSLVRKLREKLNGFACAAAMSVSCKDDVKLMSVFCVLCYQIGTSFCFRRFSVCFLFCQFTRSLCCGRRIDLVSRSEQQLKMIYSSKIETNKFRFAFDCLTIFVCIFFFFFSLIFCFHFTLRTIVVDSCALSFSHYLNLSRLGRFEFNKMCGVKYHLMECNFLSLL